MITSLQGGDQFGFRFDSVGEGDACCSQLRLGDMVQVTACGLDQPGSVGKLPGKIVFILGIACIIDLDAIQKIQRKLQFRSCPAIWMGMDQNAAIFVDSGGKFPDV